MRLGSSARPGRIAVLAAAGLVAFGYLLGGVDYVRLLRHTNRVRSEIARWEAQNERLREELKSVSSREYVEKVAKQELGLIYPDEKLYVVTQPGSSAEEAVQRRRSHEIEIGD